MLKLVPCLKSSVYLDRMLIKVLEGFIKVIGDWHITEEESESIWSNSDIKNQNNLIFILKSIYGVDR